ncbi:MAG: histone deacetylase, partial [Rickettsiales bacterium]|nr:histone deacetylase [Rickettsiales bacterium]
MIPLVFHPIYSQLSLPERHRFPIDKYQGIRNALSAHGVADNVFHTPSPFAVSELESHFDKDYVQQLTS